MSKAPRRLEAKYWLESKEKDKKRGQMIAKLFKGRKKVKWTGLSKVQEEKLLKIIYQDDSEEDETARQISPTKKVVTSKKGKVSPKKGLVSKKPENENCAFENVGSHSTKSELATEKAEEAKRPSNTADHKDSSEDETARQISPTKKVVTSKKGKNFPKKGLVLQKPENENCGFEIAGSPSKKSEPVTENAEEEKSPSKTIDQKHLSEEGENVRQTSPAKKVVKSKKAKVSVRKSLASLEPEKGPPSTKLELLTKKVEKAKSPSKTTDQIDLSEEGENVCQTSPANKAVKSKKGKDTTRKSLASQQPENENCGFEIAGLHSTKLESATEKVEEAKSPSKTADHKDSSEKGKNVHQISPTKKVVKSKKPKVSLRKSLDSQKPKNFFASTKAEPPLVKAEEAKSPSKTADQKHFSEEDKNVRQKSPTKNLPKNFKEHNSDPNADKSFQESPSKRPKTSTKLEPSTERVKSPTKFDEIVTLPTVKQTPTEQNIDINEPKDISPKKSRLIVPEITFRNLCEAKETAPQIESVTSEQSVYTSSDSLSAFGDLALFRLSDELAWAPLPKTQSISTGQESQTVDEQATKKSVKRRSTRRKSSMFLPKRVNKIVQLEQVNSLIRGLHENDVT